MATSSNPTEPTPTPGDPADRPTPIATTPPEGPPAAPEAAAAPSAARPKAKVSPARNAVAMLALVILLIVGGLELTALFQFNNAVNRLDEALEANEADLLDRSRVESLLGRAPDAPMEAEGEQMQVTTYTWRGAIRTHTLTAYYSYGQDPGLLRYEIGSAVAADPGGD